MSHQSATHERLPGARGIPRPVLAAVGLSIALIAVGIGASMWQGQPFWLQSDADLPRTGRITWAKVAEPWVYDLASKRERRLASMPPGAAITGLAWSRDGRRLVWSQFGRRAGENQSGADLWVADADGANARILLERDAPATVYESPAWAPSGRLYYTARRLEGRREVIRIERVVEGSQPEVVVEAGGFPAPLPDESAVVFVRNERSGMALWRQALNAAGDACVLLPSSVFPLIGQPRVSPDGQQVAFGGSGPASGTELRGTCAPADRLTGAERPSRAAVELPSLLDLLGLTARPAYAHGPPWDIWTVRSDGTGLRRLAALQEDEPTVAWSPTGQHVAILGASALYVVDAQGGTPRKLIDQGGYGGMDWVD